MSDSKRTGSRDISDLKARLGLKKGAAAPTTGQQQRPNGGVVAPPGLNLPPPPGVAQPAQPAMPNASDDPFGAMNAMAAVGTVQRAPEIVIVNDGNVEKVNQKSNVATIAKIGIPVVLGLVLGLFIGQTGARASFYNSGLSDAKAILGSKEQPSTIMALKQTLSKIDTVLDEARTKKQFRPDAATDKELEKLVKQLTMDDVVFKAKQNALDPEISGQLVAFYSGVAEVRSMLDAHLKLAKADEKAYSIAKAKEGERTLDENTNKDLAGNIKYAIVVSAPDDKDKTAEFGAQIVELGGVYCGDAGPMAKCPEGESPSAVAYRTELTAATWNKGDLASPSADSVPTRKVLSLLGGSVRSQFIQGAEGSASELHYQRRLRSLAERICKREPDGKCSSTSLLDLGNRLESAVDKESKKSTKFSFFL